MTGEMTRGGGRRWRVLFWGGAGLLLLVPLIAMQFTTEVAWTGYDFAVMGVMLVVAGVAVELAMRLLRRPSLRIAAILAVIAVFLLVWAQGAVGLFDHLPIA